jgi:O-antigen ligase
MRHYIIVLIIFLSNVFLISSKFVNQTASPRLFFSILSCLLIITIYTVCKNKYSLDFFSNKIVLWEIFIVCVAQACYGLLQFFGIFPSNHSKFAITGSFENPAGFSAILSMGYPIGMYLLFKTKRIELFSVAIGLFIILVSVFLSESRTGILSILSSSFLVILFQKKIIQKFQKLKQKKIIIVLSLVFFVGFGYSLYLQKKDSINGRFLIWKISSEMIIDKPILGHGPLSFKAKYMDYQGNHFKRGLSSELEILADDVIHPFNEFIKITIEYGVFGLLLITILIIYIFNKAIKHEKDNKILILSGLASFLIFAFFSYPLQYIAVWFFLLFYILQFLPPKKIIIKNTSKTFIIKTAIVLSCFLLIIITCKHIKNEIKWKDVAISSLKGNTSKMLQEYEKLYSSSSLYKDPFFLYNYGAELNVANQFEKSIFILTKCKKMLNNFDLQMLLADNYLKLNKQDKAIEIYKNASNMIPSKFLPLYYIFEIYRENGQANLAIKLANQIVNKKVKINSIIIRLIKSEASKYIKNNT